MSRKNRVKDVSGPIPLRLPEDMKIRAAEIAQKSGLSLADILRLSIERGVPAVEKMFEKPVDAAA